MSHHSSVKMKKKLGWLVYIGDYKPLLSNLYKPIINHIRFIIPIYRDYKTLVGWVIILSNYIGIIKNQYIKDSY